MTKDEALKMALDYLERHAIIDGIPARDAIREVLAQELFGNSEQLEPVAWQWLDTATFRKKIPPTGEPECWNPLYASPPQRQPLTDAEIDEIELPPSGTATVRDMVRLIEAAHGIGDKT